MMTFDEKLERYAVLRHTIEGLEAEKDALGEEIKAEVLKGARPECDLYRASLCTAQTPVAPVDCFREVYGDGAAFEVAKIDNVRAKELAKSGDLDGEALKGIALMQERHALYLEAKAYDSQTDRARVVAAAALPDVVGLGTW